MTNLLDKLQDKKYNKLELSFINNKIAKHFSDVFGERMSSVKIHRMIREYNHTGIQNEEITGLVYILI